MPRGATYAHSGVLVLNTPDVAIAANGTTGSDPELLSTDVYRNGEKCTPAAWAFDGPCLALIVTGDRDSLTDLVVANNQSSQNDVGHDPTEHGIVLQGDGQTLTNVTLAKSDWAGIESEGATNLYLDHPTFWGTVNVGLAFHGGPNGPSGNVFVQDPTIVNPGDDGIAVETYLAPKSTGCPGTPQPLQHDIWVNGENYIDGGAPTPGHGIAVVGGTNILFTNFSITNPAAAGIYVVDGQIFCDTGSNNVQMLSGAVTNGNSWATAPPSGQSPLNQGVVVVQTTINKPGQFIDNVDMENIALENTAPGVARQVWDSPYCSGCPPPTHVTFKNFLFNGTSPTTLFEPSGGSDFGTTPPSDYSISGWYVTNPVRTATTQSSGKIDLN